MENKGRNKVHEKNNKRHTLRKTLWKKSENTANPAPAKRTKNRQEKEEKETIILRYSKTEVSKKWPGKEGKEETRYRLQ